MTGSSGIVDSEQPPIADISAMIDQPKKLKILMLHGTLLRLLLCSIKIQGPLLHSRTNILLPQSNLE